MKKTLLFALCMICFLGVKAQNTIQNPFFEEVKFRGAFGTEDWTRNWANFDPQNTVYPDVTDTIKGTLVSSSGPTPEYEINSNLTLSSNANPIYEMADFSDARLQDSFFDQVDYVGAFGSTDWTSGWADFDPQNTVYPDVTDTIKGILVGTSGPTSEYEINSDLTLSASKVYLLDGWFYVTDGHTLTIEPGTIIRGNPYAAIIIERGAKIMADGTSDKPIVMTSNQPAGYRAWQDWGGLILCGKATINVAGGEAQIEGGPRSYYGGQSSPDDNDNSGILRYLRVEFPGYPFQPNKEINGITFGGVGNGTTVEYCQVSYSGDDSYEWFGGTVNCKHIIAFRGQDDEFDTDNGYSGKIQFAVGLRDPNKADVSGSNGFESDNDANGSYNKPYTSATVSNVSLFGPLATSETTYDSNFKRGMHLRRNTRFSVFNSIVAGYPVGLFIDGAASEQAAENDSLQIKNTIIAGCPNNFAINDPAALWTSTTDAQNWFLASERHNKILASNTDLHLIDPFNLTSPDFTPKAATYLLDGWFYVTSGHTLTIEPGTIIRGNPYAAIIIERGAKIMAEGTEEMPIVMTSNQPAGNRSWQDWGGLILCGKANINVSGGEAQIEGGPRSYYGGTDDGDTSGILQHLRVEFPGYPFQPNKEINGITFGGVGNGTTVNYCQVSYSGDDSYEWFGGKVNCKHLIAFRGQDDDFDTDNGFSGMVQFAVGLRDPNKADVSGSNGFESDNDANGSANLPYTNAQFSNISLFGPIATASTTYDPNFKRGMHLRRNTRFSVYNSIVAGYPVGLLIDGTLSEIASVNDSLKISHSVIAGCDADFAINDPATYWSSVTDEATWFMNQDRANDTLTENTDLNLEDPFNLDAPNFLPKSGSDMLGGSIWDVSAVEKNPLTSNSIVSVYPNPASDICTLVSDKEISGISITNMLGQVIRYQDVKQQKSVEMNVSDLRKGVYIIITKTTDNKTTTVKLLKK